MFFYMTVSLLGIFKGSSIVFNILHINYVSSIFKKKNSILYANKAFKKSICFLLIQALMDKQTLLSE